LRRTLPAQRWNTQYQQNPTSEESAIVKPAWWKPWLRRAPNCIFTVQSWDTSFGEYEKGDASACTTWGVFEPRKEPGQPQSAPPARLCSRSSAGSDKTVRLNAVSDLFRSGMVWFLDGCTLAQRTIQQFSDHPNGDADDLMDCSVQALARIREGGWVRLSNDDVDLDEDSPRWSPLRLFPDQTLQILGRTAPDPPCSFQKSSSREQKTGEVFYGTPKEVYRVEVYAQVRRAVQVEGMTVRQAARQFDCHARRSEDADVLDPRYRRSKPAAKAQARSVVGTNRLDSAAGWRSAEEAAPITSIAKKFASVR
jgi:phage terminase large subunit-like protein